MASWGCHQCAAVGKSTMHHAPFVWWAKRESIKHEFRVHGRSVYK